MSVYCLNKPKRAQKPIFIYFTVLLNMYGHVPYTVHRKCWFSNAVKEFFEFTISNSFMSSQNRCRTTLWTIYSSWLHDLSNKTQKRLCHDCSFQTETMVPGNKKVIICWSKFQRQSIRKSIFNIWYSFETIWFFIGDTHPWLVAIIRFYIIFGIALVIFAIYYLCVKLETCYRNDPSMNETDIKREWN